MPTDKPSKSDTPRMDATLGQGADWIFAEGCRLERELEQEHDIRVERENFIQMIAEAHGVEGEPHQTFFERLYERVCERTITPSHGGNMEVYEAVADAVNEIADAASEAFRSADITPGEWDGDNIVQDVKRGIVACIEVLASRSITPAATVDLALLAQGMDRLAEEGLRPDEWMLREWSKKLRAIARSGQ